MRFASISRRRRCLAAALILSPAALVLAGWPSAPARAAEPLVFSVPDEDGYGLADCFASGSGCGKSMADGWCAAHGYPEATSFGAGDMTGSIGPARSAGPWVPGVITIRCGS